MAVRTCCLKPQHDVPLIATRSTVCCVPTVSRAMTAMPWPPKPMSLQNASHVSGAGGTWPTHRAAAACYCCCRRCAVDTAAACSRRCGCCRCLKTAMAAVRPWGQQARGSHYTWVGSAPACNASASCRHSRAPLQGLVFFSDCGSRGGPGLFVAENPSVGDQPLPAMRLHHVATQERHCRV